MISRYLRMHYLALSSYYFLVDDSLMSCYYEALSTNANNFFQLFIFKFLNVFFKDQLSRRDDRKKSRCDAN